jgi:hypothetical protein
MLFSEIAVQNVAGFPAATRLPLRPGLNALVSKQTDVFALLRALLSPSEADAALAGPGAPRKIALTIVADDGTTYRLIRDLDGGRSLLRSDPATRQPLKVSEDPGEITQLLRTAIGLPSDEGIARHLWLCAADLPSRNPLKPISKPGADKSGQTAAVPETVPMTREEAKRRAAQLKAELVRSETFDQAQDGVYQLQQKVRQIIAEAAPPTDIENKVADLTQQIESLQRALGGLSSSESKLRKYPEAVARRDGALDALKKKRAEYAQGSTFRPDLNGLVQDRRFYGGLAGGLACIVGGSYLHAPLLLVTDLIPFGLAAFCAWRWVSDVEGAEENRHRLSDLDDLEKKVQKQFDQEVAPINAAMSALGAATPEVVVGRLDERDRLDARRAALLRELDMRRKDPRMLALDIERQHLESELKRQEEIVASIGFVRDTMIVRRELKLAEDAATAVGDPLMAAIDAAAGMAQTDSRVLLESFRERLSQYFAALTDRRFTGVRIVGPGQCHVVAATGASGPLGGLPAPDQDLIYVALRLGLAERVAGPAKRPILVDEPSVLVDGNHRGLFVKMLQTLGAATQVVVRAFEPPPPGAVDHVASAGSSVV